MSFLCAICVALDAEGKCEHMQDAITIHDGHAYCYEHLAAMFKRNGGVHEYLCPKEKKT